MKKYGAVLLIGLLAGCQSEDKITNACIDCGKFQIEHLTTQKVFIADAVDQTVLASLKKNIATTQKITGSFDQQIKQYYENFKNLKDASLSFSIHPSLITSPQFLTVQLQTQGFLGGAHGMTEKKYLVFDHQKQIFLDDIVLPQQKQALEKLVYLQYQQWVISQQLADRLDDYEQAWPFKMTHNFYFTSEGLVLQYNEYEIAPYSAGMPIFTIKYADLKNILKPEYEPKTI